MIEVYKAKNNRSPDFMKDVYFENRSNFHLRSDNHLQLPKVFTTRYSAENVMYRATFYGLLQSCSILSECNEYVRLCNEIMNKTRFCKNLYTRSRIVVNKDLYSS